VNAGNDRERRRELRSRFRARAQHARCTQVASYSEPFAASLESPSVPAPGDARCCHVARSDPSERDGARQHGASPA
jgi:hypothetical protein